MTRFVDSFLVLNPQFKPELGAASAYRPHLPIISEIEKKIGSKEIEVLPLEGDLGLWIDSERWKVDKPSLNLWGTALLGLYSTTQTPEVLIGTVVVTNLTAKHLPRGLSEEQSARVEQVFKLDSRVLLQAVRKQLISQYGYPATALLTNVPEREASVRPATAATTLGVTPVTPATPVEAERSPWAPPRMN